MKISDGQSNFKNRLTLSMNLLVISLPCFIWYFLLDGTFYAKQEKTIGIFFLLLAIICFALAVFFLAGGRFAYLIQDKVGLASPPEKERKENGKSTYRQSHINNLAACLQLFVLCTLTFGWICYVTTGTNTGDIVGSGISCIVCFALIPLLLTPYCARAKKTALLTVFLFFSIFAIVLLIKNWSFLFGDIPQGARRVWNMTVLFYGLLSWAVVYLSAMCLILRPKK